MLKLSYITVIWRFGAYTKPYKVCYQTVPHCVCQINQTRTVSTSPAVIECDVMALFVGIDDVGNLKKVGEVFVSINNASVDVKLYT